MTNIEELKKVIKENERVLREEYKISKIGIFGSFARNEQSESSDVDILVDFSEPVGFLFFQAERFLSEKLSMKVDMVTEDAIKPRIKDKIMKELVYVG